MSNTEARVRKLIAEHMGLIEADVTPEKGMVADLGFDSLDTVEVVMAIEDEFGIEIADDDWEATKTVAEAVALVDRVNGAAL